MAPPPSTDFLLRNLRDLFVGRSIQDEYQNTLSPSGIAVGGVGETQLLLPTLNTAFVDSAASAVVGAKKTVYLVVTTNLTWASSGQATWQPFVSRAAFAAAGGAATQLTTSQVKLGSAQNLGAAAQTSLPAGLYRLSPATVAELQWPDALIGMELQFPSALTGGAAALYVEAST